MPVARRPPTRSCVACRTPRDKSALLRVVRTPNGTLVNDPTGRLAGRGAYVCRDASCITTAIKRGALSRALETPVPAALLEALSGSIDEDITQGGARGQK